MKVVYIILGLLLAAPAVAEENWVPSATPIPIEEPVGRYWVQSVEIQRGLPEHDTDDRIEIRIMKRLAAGNCSHATNGTCQTLACTYDWQTTPTAHDLLVQLNKANMSTTSFVARVLNRAATDNCIPAGAISGTPE